MEILTLQQRLEQQALANLRKKFNHSAKALIETPFWKRLEECEVYIKNEEGRFQKTSLLGLFAVNAGYVNRFFDVEVCGKHLADEVNQVTDEFMRSVKYSHEEIKKLNKTD